MKRLRQVQVGLMNSLFISVPESWLHRCVRLPLVDLGEQACRDSILFRGVCTPKLLLIFSIVPNEESIWMAFLRCLQDLSLIGSDNPKWTLLNCQLLTSDCFEMRRRETALLFSLCGTAPWILLVISIHILTARNHRKKTCTQLCVWQCYQTNGASCHVLWLLDIHSQCTNALCSLSVDAAVSCLLYFFFGSVFSGPTDA